MSDHQTHSPPDVRRCRALIERHLRKAAGVVESDDRLAYDSVMLAEVIVSIEDEKGITIPKDEQTAKALRSIESFAEYLNGLGALEA